MADDEIRGWKKDLRQADLRWSEGFLGSAPVSETRKTTVISSVD
jgi:hypothetical protein